MIEHSVTLSMLSDERCIGEVSLRLTPVDADRNSLASFYEHKGINIDDPYSLLDSNSHHFRE
jgi:hypothetical protein